MQTGPVEEQLRVNWRGETWLPAEGKVWAHAAYTLAASRHNKPSWNTDLLYPHVFVIFGAIVHCSGSRGLLGPVDDGLMCVCVTTEISLKFPVAREVAAI